MLQYSSIMAQGRIILKVVNFLQFDKTYKAHIFFFKTFYNVIEIENNSLLTVSVEQSQGTSC